LSIFQLVFTHESFHFLLLHNACHLVSCVLYSVYLSEVLELGVKIETVVLENVFFVVFFGLGFEGVGDGDESVDVVPADFEFAALHVFVACVGAGFIVLEAPFVFFFGVVVCEVDGGEDEVGVVLQIRVEVEDLLVVQSCHFAFHEVVLERAVFFDLLDDIIEMSTVHHSEYRLGDVLLVDVGSHGFHYGFGDALDLVEVEFDIVEGCFDLIKQHSGRSFEVIVADAVLEAIF
jgi:hypothetical protein